MIPFYDLSEYGEHSAYKKIAEWLSPTRKDINSNGLALGLPPEFSYANRFHTYRTFTQYNDLEDFKSKAYELYNCVVEVIGKNLLLRLSSLHPSGSETVKIIQKLRDLGFDVSRNDITDIMRIAMAIRDDKFKPEKIKSACENKWRHASLNCYDFDRLLNESNLLAEKVSYSQLEKITPTLATIIKESTKDQHTSYPGRHLPFKDIRGRSAWRYQCLRMMDEILCSSQYCLNDNEMIAKIKEKCDKYRIQYTKISQGTLKKLYIILSELINVEQYQGNKTRYNRDVYVSGRKGHLYNIYKGQRRLSAFTVDISVEEAYTLRKEIGILRAKYFNDDRSLFAKEYPLISMLGYIDELTLNNDNNSVNEVYETDLVTINYQPEELAELKKKISKLVSLQIPIAVKRLNSWEIVLPVCVKTERRKWVLIAKSIESSALRLIMPEELIGSLKNQTAETGATTESSWDTTADIDRNIVGISPLIDSHLYDIQLLITMDGIKDVERKNSVFNPLKPDISTETSRLYADKGTVKFSAYINSDLLNEILRLDRAGNLISVSPIQVSDIYEDFFIQQMKFPRTPYEDRPPHKKRLASPKQNVSE